MSEAITVIIPAYGPGPHLEEVVASLKRELPASGRIIVSHSGSGDPTPRFADDPSVRVLHSDQRLFAGAARNRGMAAADTEWVAFVDEDVVVGEGWYAAVRRAIEAGDADCILGAIGFETSGGYWGTALWFIEFGSVHPYMTRRPVAGGPSGNMVIRRDRFAAVGGFPEDWRMGQDSLAHSRLAAAGNRIIFDPSLVVRHYNLPGARRMVRHLFHIGRHSARLRREQPHLAGSWAVRRPLLSTGMWAARTAQMARRVLGARQAPKGRFLIHLPGILIGLAAWNSGFTREALRPNFQAGDY
jgi:GT2 family glycosyltransferase